MSKYNLTVNCKNVSVEYASANYMVEISVEEVELDDILAEIGSNEVLDHFTHDDIAQYVRDNNIDITD